MFRSSTLSRFTQTLQTQYDSWLKEQAEIKRKAEEEARITGGYENNPKAANVAAVVDEFKAVLAEANLPNLNVLQARLDEVAKLAALRNDLTRVETGTECDRRVRKAGFLTHFDDNTKGLDEHAKKGYVLNMLDTVINGFLQAAAGMTNKKTQVPEFMHRFNGACVEAKGDNIQEWIGRATGIIKGAYSDESHDLAYSIAAEFAVIAENVRKPYYEEARKSCEAEVRETCARKGITDEETIKSRIESRAATIVMQKDDEIKPKIKEKLEKSGRFAAYDALAGARRPLTEITKDESTGKWTVTTLVDENNQPILKSVSGFDIDKNFSKMVDMYLEDAITMGDVTHQTRVARDVVFASWENLRDKEVVALAGDYASGDAGKDKAELAKLVKAEIPFAAEIPEDKFTEFLETALGEVTALKDENPAAAWKKFHKFALNYANSSYYDKTNDRDRLIHLLASRVATLADPVKRILNDIDGIASRCAQMMKNTYQQDHNVNEASAKDYIKLTLERMVKLAYGDATKDTSAGKQAAKALHGLAENGVMFSDCLLYELGHRAGGRNEVQLYEYLKYLQTWIRIQTSAEPDRYMSKAKG